ncbi:MepB family protein, partial [Candidatus Dependentiae bacterium]|nr:MepB family protein [Candidatus Dependentiae bacterium]
MKWNTIHPDFLAAQQLAYEPNGLLCSTVLQDVESQEYGACTLKIDSKIIKFRVANITPTKIGHFVTFWKRVGHGPIMPYTMNDPFDLLVVSVRNANKFGQFVFPKELLGQKGLVTTDKQAGKRAMRVYS